MTEIAWQKEIGRIARVLCGTVQPTFPEEKQVRLFQLKIWLLSEHRDDQKILHDAKKFIVSARLGDLIKADIRHARKQGDHLTPADALIDMCEDKDPAGLINLLYGSQIDHYSPSDVQSIEPYEILSKSFSKEANSLIEYTNCCMRVAASGLAPIKSNSMFLYKYLAEQNGLSMDIQQLITARRARLSFLYAATLYEKRPLTRLAGTGASLWQLLTVQTQGKEPAFARYFARCASVQQVMSHGSELSAAKVSEWSNEEPAPIDLAALTDAEKRAITND